MTLKEVAGYIIDPLTSKQTYNYCVKSVLEEYEKLKNLHFELTNKGISFSKNFPELYDDYKLLFELKIIIECQTKETQGVSLITKEKQDI